MRLAEAEIDIMFITKGENVEYINESADSMFDERNRFDGRVVKLIYTGQSSSSELSVFVAFDDAESWTLFTMQAGSGTAVEFRLNYVLNAVHKHLALNSSLSMLPYTEGYDTQYEYTYKLFKEDEYGYLMVNASHTKAYQINVKEKLIKSPETWKPGEW